MAIQISGTTVVNNSRQLQNIGSLDSTTLATFNAAGIGASPSLTPTLSGGSSVPMFSGSGYTLTVSTYSSYTDPIFFYVIDDGSSNTAQGSWGAASIQIAASELPSGNFNIRVIALDVGKAASAQTSKSVSASTVTARYWRMGITAGGAGSEGVGEWRLFSGASQTGTDWTPTSITATAYYNSTYLPAKARDGNVNTMWWPLGSTGRHYLTYDLGQARTVASTSIISYGQPSIPNTYSAGASGTDASIESSTNNSTWTMQVNDLNAQDTYDADPGLFTGIYRG